MTTANDLRRVSFTVLGKAEPGGSKTAYILRGKPRVVDSNQQRVMPWRLAVSEAGLRAMKGRLPFTGPVVLHVIFYLARPKGHYRNGTNEPRESAPSRPTTRPDATKLLRPLEDALTGIIWMDDAQIVDQMISKEYGFPPRAEIRCEMLGDGQLGGRNRDAERARRRAENG